MPYHVVEVVSRARFLLKKAPPVARRPSLLLPRSPAHAERSHKDVVPRGQRGVCLASLPSSGQKTFFPSEFFLSSVLSLVMSLISRCSSPHALHTHRPWVTVAVQEGISSSGAFRTNHSLGCPPSFRTAPYRSPPLATLLLRVPAPTRLTSCARSPTQ